MTQHHGHNENERPHKHAHPEPITFEALDKDIQERSARISDEFQKAFDFLKGCEKSVTFWGSARTRENEKEYLKAKSLAKRISEELGYAIVTGGGPGIMQAANCGAGEVNGKSVGLTIQLPMEQVTNSCVTDHMDFYYFFSRKVALSFAAEAYVYFPGGFGTLDELFEILTLVQTGKIKHVPIILVGKKYWKGLDKFIKKHLLKNEKISPDDTNLYTITEDEDEIIEIIKNAPIRKTG